VLNATLDGLERSFAQATRFSSDASHELNTPLTVMRCEIESALKVQVNSPEVERGIVVHADQSYLRQALLNLLDKAIKYNVDSSAISLSLRKSGPLAFFRISNTGPEIPENDKARIFERFYRVDPSHTSDLLGSGLGLSLCREIALAHGGSIWLDRQESGWTAFVLALPCPDE
jgi:signal transduction histidine kinase